MTPRMTGRLRRGHPRSAISVATPADPAVTTSRQAVRTLRDAFDALACAAMPPPQSAQLITRLARLTRLARQAPPADIGPPRAVPHGGRTRYPRYPPASLRTASSAYSAVPVASTASSKTASAEWLNGAVNGSVPSGHAPIMRKAPGTCSST